MPNTLPTRLTSRNFDDIKEDMLRSIPTLAPEWTNHGDDDYGIAILDIVAGVGDGLHYYVDRLVLENYLRTATLPQSVYRIAEMLQYRPKRWVGSQGYIRVFAENPLSTNVSVPAMTQLDAQGSIPLTLLEPINLSAGFQGTALVKAVQGRRQTQTLTVDSSRRLPFPAVNVAEQFFTVTSSAGEWYDAFEHPLDSELERFYYQEIDDQSRYWLTFRPSRGDVPAEGTVMTVNYMETTGSNLSAGLSIAAPFGEIELTTADFLGGRRPETLSQIKDRAAAKIYTRDRAVTREDYEQLARRVPGVKSVHVIKDPYGVRKVDVYVAGETEDEPTPMLLEQLRDFYLERNTITVDVVTHPRQFKDFRLHVEVKPTPSAAVSTVLNEVQTRLANFLSYQNLTFSRPVRVSDIYHIIEATPGVDYSNILALHWEGETGVGNLISSGPEYPNLVSLVVNLIP